MTSARAMRRGTGGNQEHTLEAAGGANRTFYLKLGCGKYLSYAGCALSRSLLALAPLISPWLWVALLGEWWTAASCRRAALPCVHSRRKIQIVVRSGHVD